jgi:hypothetical protein
VGKKGYKRRYIFSGWNNYTPFEKQFIQKVKNELKDKHGLDLSLLKPYGPREENGRVYEGKSPIVSGRDYHLNDSDILRFSVGRHFVLNDTVSDLIFHLQWRQTNVPMPYLCDATLKILKTGMFYIHGRTMELQPILVLDFGPLRALLDKNEIDAHLFCSLHNFMSRYMIANMMVPGQVEKWITIANIN